MKKHLVWLMVLTGLVLTACGTSAVPDGVKIETLAQTGDHLVIAHRGDRATKPTSWYEPEWGNSVQAIRNALDAGSPRVEIDVKLNRSSQALAENPDGILYVHHDATCTEINSDGTRKISSLRYVTHEVETDPPYLVDRCAERLSNILAMRDKYGQSTARRWVLEMKTGRYNTYMPSALFNLLTQRGQRTTEIISSLDENMLSALRGLGLNLGFTMNLMHVYPLGYGVGRQQIDHTRSKGFNYIAVNHDHITSADVDYAKSRGLNVGGWNWRAVSAQDANTWAVNRDLDFMLTDNIYDLAARPGWGW